VNNGKQAYHEDLLHWIWDTRHLNPRQLATTEGQNITIHDTGQANKSDGPDFTGAEISIGKLRWYGDVEIHWKASDWMTHGHHGDPNFEQVILHVVFEETGQQIQHTNGSTIPTLCLSNYLDKPLESFLEQYKKMPQLPCSGKFSFISKEAFSKQLEQAHKEYFEQKVDDLLEFYDPNLPPSAAWQKMLTVALFDGLGISHNRRPMRKLGARLFAEVDQYQSAKALRSKALAISGIDKSNNSQHAFCWNHRGVRPGNHPRPRIQQGADCLWHITSTSFQNWMRTEPKKSWEQMINAISVSPSLGSERGDILFGTVFLPALYSLGNLFFCDQLKSQSWSLWKDHQVQLPSSLLCLLEQTKLPPSLYAQKLGTIHQLRSYCKPKNCQHCKVFKSAISS